MFPKWYFNDPKILKIKFVCIIPPLKVFFPLTYLFKAIIFFMLLYTHIWITILRYGRKSLFTNRFRDILKLLLVDSLPLNIVQTFLKIRTINICKLNYIRNMKFIIYGIHYLYAKLPNLKAVFISVRLEGKLFRRSHSGIFLNFWSTSLGIFIVLTYPARTVDSTMKTKTTQNRITYLFISFPFGTFILN